MLGDELGVHNQVFLLGGDGSLEVLESCQLKLATENFSVEFDGFSGVTGEGEIGVELDSHGWPFSKVIERSQRITHRLIEKTI